MDRIVHEVGIVMRMTWAMISWLERVVYPDQKFRAEVRIAPRHETNIAPLRIGAHYDIPRLTLNLTRQNLSAYSLVIERLMLKIDVIDAVWYGGERAFTHP